MTDGGTVVAKILEVTEGGRGMLPRGGGKLKHRSTPPQEIRRASRGGRPLS